jgi:CRP/FNR family transcriptional regulator
MGTIFDKYCSKEWLEFINFHKKIQSYPAKGIIFKEGDLTQGFFTIRHGKVKVVSEEPDNRQRLIRIAADDDIIGHRGFFGNWKYPVSAIALTPTQVSFLPTEIFVQVVKANSELSYRLIEFFADELRLSEEKHILMPVKNKLAKAILMNYNVFGFENEKSKKLSYTLSRQDFADYIGTTYETIIRELSNLNQSGAIKSDGKSIIIKNMKLLQKLAMGQ